MGEPRTASPHYRPDLEGIRGVGAIAVVLYHATGAFPSGGFIAVDLFFVISGYLITEIIGRAVERRTFTFRDFYARRAKRLFPALLVVLCATIGLGWVFLLPDELRLVGRHAASGAFFYPNFAMRSEPGGYFATGLDFRPLLPLWSLGVEEQFYLLWPPLLLLVLRRRASLPIVLAVLCALSFAVNMWLSLRHPVAAYYLPFGRAWEILAGAALTLIKKQPSPTIADIASIVGALIILIGFLIVPSEGFPGAWALVPVVGTGLIIWSGPNAPVNRILASPFLVFLGLISYPVYLWHWPLLTIQTITTGQEWSMILRILTAVFSFFLGWLTYRFIERPARISSAPKLIAGLCAGMVTVGAVGFAIAGSNGLPQRFPPQIQRVIAARPEMLATVTSVWREGRCFLYVDESPRRDVSKDPEHFLPECVETGPRAAAPLVVIWGDSHGAAFYSGLPGIREDLGIRLAQFTIATCPPVLSRAVAEPLNEAQRRCTASNDRTLEEVLGLRPRIVVLAASWGAQPRLTPGISVTVLALRAQGIKVVLLGQAPSWTPILPKQILTHYRAYGTWPERLPMDLTQTREIDAQIAAVARRDGAVFLSPTAVLCDTRGCLTGVGDPPFLTTFDLGHMTPEGARLLANAFAAELKP